MIHMVRKTEKDIMVCGNYSNDCCILFLSFTMGDIVGQCCKRK